MCELRYFSELERNDKRFDTEDGEGFAKVDYGFEGNRSRRFE